MLEKSETYSVVALVLVVEKGWVHMMSLIPVDVDEAPIIGLSLHNLFFRDFEAFSVLVVAFAHCKDLSSFLGAHGRAAILIDGDGRSHIFENDVVSAWHFYFLLLPK